MLVYVLVILYYKNGHGQKVECPSSSCFIFNKLKAAHGALLGAQKGQARLISKSVPNTHKNQCHGVAAAYAFWFNNFFELGWLKSWSLMFAQFNLTKLIKIMKNSADFSNPLFKNFASLVLYF